MSDQRWQKDERPEQADLFGDPDGVTKPDWEKEWKDMPEFNQDRLTCYSEVLVRFSNENDMKDFAKLIGQTVNRRTTYVPSIWHPKLKCGACSQTRYIDNES